MSITDYALIACGLFLQWGFGRLFFKHHYATSLLAGLSVSGCLISVSARYVPLYTIHILAVLAILGLAGLWRERKILKAQWQHCVGTARAEWRTYAEHALWFLLVAIFLRYFHYTNYLYESHDVLYFSPSLEMLLADYTGNLRYATYYPLEFATYNLIASAWVAIIDFLNPHPNLMQFVEARYFLFIITIAPFLHRFRQLLKVPFLPFVIAVLGASMLFGEEMMFNLVISSYVFILVMLYMLLHLLELLLEHDRNSPERKSALEVAILFFALMLIMGKAQMFFIAAAMVAVFMVPLRHHFFRWQLWLVGVLILANLYTWATFPKTEYLKYNSKYFIDNNLTNARFTERVYWNFIDRPSRDAMEIIQRKYHHTQRVAMRVGYWSALLPHANYFIVPYMFIKCWGVFLALLWVFYRQLKHTEPEKPLYPATRWLLGGMVFYIVLGILSTIFINNIGRVLQMTFNYMLVGMTMSWFMVVVIASARIKLLVPLMAVALYMCNGTISQLPNYFITVSLKELNRESITYSMANIQHYGNFYQPKLNEPVWLSQVNALMSGMRFLERDIYAVTGREHSSHWAVYIQRQIVRNNRRAKLVQEQFEKEHKSLLPD